MAFQTPETYPATASFPTGSSFPASASFPSAYDPVAATYITANSVTNDSQKLNISQFITGLRKNDFFNSMVEGWTFRSNQSIGSGASAPGLKGIYSFSLTASPTWGANGLTFNGSTQYGSFTAQPLALGSQNHTLVAIWSTASTITTQFVFGMGNSGTNNPIDNIDFVAGVGDTAFRGFLRDGAGTAFQADAAKIDAASLTSVNGANYSASATVGFANTSKQFWSKRVAYIVAQSLVTTTVRIGASPIAAPAAFTNGEISAAFIFDKAFDNTANLAFYNLYKATIGQGLSLP